VVEFFQTHFAFLGPAYSVAYGLVNGLGLRFIAVAEVLAIYFVIEMAIPKGRRNSLAATWRGALFNATSLTFNTFLFTAIYAVLAREDLVPLFHVDISWLTKSEHLPLRVLGWIGAAFGIAMVGDVFYYWLHRAQHGVPVLWRFHRVHHSIEEMSAVSSYHHIAEETMQYFAVVIPIALFLKIDAEAVPWLVTTLVGTHNYFIHSSMNVNIGPLRYIFADNHYHRIHHSLEPQHFNKNFGTATPWWDIVFGTAYFPKRGEWPKTGLSDVPEPRTVKDYITLPFRK
jgi:sterol desaturase/sphingolipid hydroxylase (fatty acid hydroxylase superfamily)